jgi:hypothetical protein
MEKLENLLHGSLSRGRRHIGPQLPNMRKVVWRPVAPYHQNGDREPKDPYHVEGGMDICNDYSLTHMYIYIYIFAGPWPRACQIICFLCLLQHLLRL